MAWLVYTRGLRGPSPRIIIDVDKAGNPILGAAERGDGVVLAQHRLRAGEEKLPIARLMLSYPPPRPPEQTPPVTPNPPPAPKGGAAAKRLEAA